MKKSPGPRILAVLLIGLAIAFFFRRSWTFHLISLPHIIHWVDMARADVRLTILFYFMFVIGIMVFPVTLYPILGGVLLDFQYALPLNLLAATLGSYGSFLITRKLARNVIEGFLKGRWKVFDHLTARQGFKSVLLLRLMGIPPFIVTNYMLGLSGVRGRDFILGTAVGILPWMTVVTFAANSLWDAAVTGGQEGLKKAVFKLILPFSIISLSILATTLAGFLLKKNRKGNF